MAVYSKIMHDVTQLRSAYSFFCLLCCANSLCSHQISIEHLWDVVKWRLTTLTTTIWAWLRCPMELPKIFQIHDTQRTNPVYLDDCDIPAQLDIHGSMWSILILAQQLLNKMLIKLGTYIHTYQMIRPPSSYPKELLQFAFFPCKTNYARMLITAWQSRVL